MRDFFFRLGLAMLVLAWLEVVNYFADSTHWRRTLRRARWGV